jgi:hypothetical protein
MEVSMLRFSLTAMLVLLLTLPLFATTYYVDAAKGDDANPGTAIGAPWKTLYKANAALSPGDTCIVRAGVYAGTQIAPAKSGTPDALITYAAYEGETPEVTGGKSGSIIYLRDRAFIVVKGFRIHSPTEHDWTVNLSGKDCTHNVIANCDVSDPKGYVCIDIADGASYNEVSGCVAHDTGNADEQSGDCIVMNSGASHNAILQNKCFNGCHSQIMALKGSKFNLIADNDRMPGVVPAVVAYDVVGLLGKVIDNLALRLVAPLHPDNYHICHSADPHKTVPGGISLRRDNAINLSEPAPPVNARPAGNAEHTP